MKNFLKHSLLLLVVLAATVACDRKSLETECLCDVTALLPVRINWDNLTEDPTNVRLLVYNQDDSELVAKYTYAHNPDADIQAYLPLAIGEYQIIVINEASGDLENISIADEYDYSTTKFYVAEVAQAVKVLDEDDDDMVYLDELDELAVHTIQNVVVSEDMVYSKNQSSLTSKELVISKSSTSTTNYVSEMLLDITPLRKDVRMTITLNVEGMESAHDTVLVDLRNVADGYVVADNKNTTTPANMQFYMSNKTTEDDTPTITTINSDVTMFGTLDNRLSVDYYSSVDYSLQFVLTFYMLDGTTQTRVFDVTELTNTSENEYTGEISVEFELNVAGDGDNGKLPDVDPTVTDGTGNVGDWGDEDEQKLDVEV